MGLVTVILENTVLETGFSDYGSWTSKFSLCIFNRILKLNFEKHLCVGGRQIIK